jgi:hypothetical protein
MGRGMTAVQIASAGDIDPACRCTFLLQKAFLGMRSLMRIAYFIMRRVPVKSRPDGTRAARRWFRARLKKQSECTDFHVEAAARHAVRSCGFGYGRHLFNSALKRIITEMRSPLLPPVDLMIAPGIAPKGRPVTLSKGMTFETREQMENYVR